MNGNCIEEELNSNLKINGDEIDTMSLFKRLNMLNMIHHLVLRNGTSTLRFVGSENHDRFQESIEDLIGTAKSFHSFLVQNRMALDEVKSNLNALVFGRVSDIVSMYEEYITKEDPIQDILLQLVPFLLSAFSEKSYISSAEIGQKGILREHALNIYSDLYSFLKKTRNLEGNDEGKEIAGMMEQLYKALDRAVGEKHGLYLFAGLYLAIFNLRAGEIINMVNQRSEKTKTEV